MFESSKITCKLLVFFLTYRFSFGGFWSNDIHRRKTISEVLYLKKMNLFWHAIFFPKYNVQMSKPVIVRNDTKTCIFGLLTGR